MLAPLPFLLAWKGADPYVRSLLAFTPKRRVVFREWEEVHTSCLLLSLHPEPVMRTGLQQKLVSSEADFAEWELNKQPNYATILLIGLNLEPTRNSESEDLNPNSYPCIIPKSETYKPPTSGST